MGKFDITAEITVDTSNVWGGGMVNVETVKAEAARYLRGVTSQGARVTAVEITDVQEHEPEITLTQSALDQKVQDAVAAALAAAGVAVPVPA